MLSSATRIVIGIVFLATPGLAQTAANLGAHEAYSISGQIAPFEIGATEATEEAQRVSIEQNTCGEPLQFGEVADRLQGLETAQTVVPCCCQTVYGGSCCNYVVTCGRFVPGCQCR